MIALDTNVVVRLLVRDDPRQTARAANVVAENKVLLTTSVILEVECVLRFTYCVPREAILAGLRRLIGLDQLTVDHPTVAIRALDLFERGLDLADALHLASSAAAAEFATFDRKLARRAKALEAVPVVRLCG